MLTIQTGINEPRYANLRAIKQAEQVRDRRPQRRATAAARRTACAGCSCPSAGEGAEMLDGSAAEVAGRIAEIVKERLA